MAHLIYTNREQKEARIELLTEVGAGTVVSWIEAAQDAHEDYRRSFLELFSGMTASADGQLLVYEPAPDRRVYLLISEAEKHRSRNSRTNGENRSDQGRRSANAMVILLRAEHQWLIQAELGTRLWVDGERVAVLKLLRHESKIDLGGVDLTFRELVHRQVDTALERQLAGHRCPYCQCGFEEGESFVFCPGCGTAEHGECWAEFNDCCSGPTGCPYAVVRA